MKLKIGCIGTRWDMITIKWSEIEEEEENDEEKVEVVKSVKDEIKVVEEREGEENIETKNEEEIKAGEKIEEGEGVLKESVDENVMDKNEEMEEESMNVEKDMGEIAEKDEKKDEVEKVENEEEEIVEENKNENKFETIEDNKTEEEEEESKKEIVAEHERDERGDVKEEIVNDEKEESKNDDEMIEVPLEEDTKERSAEKDSGEEREEEIPIYEVQIRKKGIISFVFAYEGCDTQHVFYGLDPDTTYEFIVRRKSDTESGPWSPIFPQKTSPLFVESFTAHDIGYDTATLSWDALQGASGKKVVYQVSLQRGYIHIDGVPRPEQKALARHEPSIVFNGGETQFTTTTLEPLTQYFFFIRIGCNGHWSEWSKPLEINTSPAPFPGFWREGNHYVVERGSKMVVTKTQLSAFTRTSVAVPGCSLISSGVVDWGVKVIKSWSMDIYVGVAPCDIYYINPKDIAIYGWYIHLRSGSLYSSAPHNFAGIRFVQKGSIKQGDVIGCQVNMDEKSISFSVNGKFEGVAYNEIFADIPLVPVVLLKNRGDSVGLLSASFFQEKW